MTHSESAGGSLGLTGSLKLRSALKSLSHGDSLKLGLADADHQASSGRWQIAAARKDGSEFAGTALAAASGPRPRRTGCLRYGPVPSFRRHKRI